MKNILFIAAILLGVLVACSDDEDDNGVVERQVLMTQSTFDPENLTIDAGTTVTWVNNSTVVHTVTHDGGLFNETLSVGEEFEFTFNERGVYNYVCTLHPGMSGTITVE